MFRDLNKLKQHGPMIRNRNLRSLPSKYQPTFPSFLNKGNVTEFLSLACGQCTAPGSHKVTLKESPKWEPAAGESARQRQSSHYNPIPSFPATSSWEHPGLNPGGRQRGGAGDHPSRSASRKERIKLGGSSEANRQHLPRLSSNWFPSVWLK